MELGLRLSQKQTLKLVMTPRLQQALKLLQMPSLELSQHIEQELLTNPLLELEEEDTAPEAPAEVEAPEPAADTAESSPDDDFDWSNFTDDQFEYGDGVRNEREELDFFEKIPVGRASLLDDLTEQLHLLEMDEETERIAEYLLGCLDENGFLVVPLEEAAEQLGAPLGRVERALERIQELDPPGVGARDLPDSLRIQLRLRGREDSLAARIVADHFEAFKQKQYQDIARALKVQPADIQEAGREIATLNPRPGAQLGVEDSPYVVPDLVVEKVDGQYVVSLADGSIPRLRVSNKYREILRRDAKVNGAAPEKAVPAKGADGGSDGGAEGDVAAESQESAAAAAASRVKDRRAEEVRFVQEKLKSASWLIQTIEQRRRTMIKVMEAIVEAQYDFFEQGPQAIRPLTLQDVAEKIGMHESTVSRVTTNKYVQTPRGVLPLKYFFSSSLDTDSGHSVSSKMAIERIRLLIEKEDRRRPLSDQKIAEMLGKEGVVVARRTVAKYREKLNILPARYRKEF